MAVAQPPLFTQSSAQDLRDYERRRAGIDRLFDEAVRQLPEAERRASASQLGFLFVADLIFDETPSGRLVHQFCIFHTRIRGGTAVERALNALELDEDVAQALRMSYPALIQLGKKAFRDAFAAKNLMSGASGIVFEPRIGNELKSGSVFLARLVPFDEYALPLVVPAELTPDMADLVYRRLARLAQSLGISRSSLSSAFPRLFELEAFRTATERTEQAEQENTTLRALSYSRGIYEDAESPDDESTEFVIDLKEENLPPDVVEAFDYEGIGLLDGDHGDPSLAENVEIDALRYRTDGGERRIRFFNRGLSLLRSDPVSVRLSRFLCRLLEAAMPDVPVPEHRLINGENHRPRSFNWNAIGPLFERRMNVMSSALDHCGAVITVLDIHDAFERISLPVESMLDDIDLTIGLFIESYVFGTPENEQSPIERYAETSPYPPGSEEELVLHAMLGARPSLWRVIDAVPGHGMIVQDPWDEEETHITLVADKASLGLGTDDVFFANLVDFGDFALAPNLILPMSVGAVDHLYRRFPAEGLLPGAFTNLCLEAYLAGSGQARPPTAAARKTPRNAPCPCGSGKKYKRCCGRSASIG